MTRDSETQIHEGSKNILESYNTKKQQRQPKSSAGMPESSSSLPLAIAEALAYVGTERPLLPRKTPEESALIMMSAYLKKDTFPGTFAKLEHACRLHDKTAEVIQQKRLTGTEPSDYDALVREFDMHNV